MARIAINGLKLKAVLFGAPTLLKTTTVSSAVAAVGFPTKMGRNFSGVVACASPAAAEAAAPTKTRKPRGIMKPRPISPEFQEFVGAPEISRTQALKVIWDHIKANKLQDPNNKKIINCDEKLKKIFAGKETVGFLEISGLITPHLL